MICAGCISICLCIDLPRSYGLTCGFIASEQDTPRQETQGALRGVVTGHSSEAEC